MRESRVGSRVVRWGTSVYVSGTTATDGSGGFVGVGDDRTQTSQVLSSVKVALEAVGQGSRTWYEPESSCWTSTNGERSERCTASFSAGSGLRPSWSRYGGFFLPGYASGSRTMAR